MNSLDHKYLSVCQNLYFYHQSSLPLQSSAPSIDSHVTGIYLKGIYGDWVFKGLCLKDVSINISFCLLWTTTPTSPPSLEKKNLKNKKKRKKERGSLGVVFFLFLSLHIKKNFKKSNGIKGLENTFRAWNFFFQMVSKQ